MSRPKVLVLRALGLGDLLTGVPALRGLRRAFPGHELVLAAPARLRRAVEAVGCVDRLLPTTAPGREVPSALPWSGPPPDVAVDLHGNGPASRDLLRALSPGRLLGFAGPDIAAPGPRWRAEEHERDRWCRLLRWYGLPADPEDLQIATDAMASPAPGAVVVHPGADAGSRRWPPARFAAVARALHRRGLRVVVTAGAGEGPQARRVAGAAELPEGSVLGGDRDVPFGELAALLATSRLVVSGDTGLSHLAAAVAAPSVTLFGPVSPALWGPPDLPRHRALWHPDPGDGVRPGDAHGDRPDPRLLRITVDVVLAAADALLLGRADARR